MPKITKRQSWALLCLLMLLFAGCGKLLPTPEPVTITFPHFERDTAYYELLAQQFHEQNPYISVELVTLPRPSLTQMITHDVFITDQLALPEMLRQGQILNVTPFIEQDEGFNVEDFYAGTIATFHYEGKIWGVPADLDMLMMYYNADVFDRYGVPYPQIGWTWQDFLDRAIDTTRPNDDLFGYALQYNNEMAVMEPLVFIYQHGGQIFDSWQNPTLTTLNDPLNIEAMEWYAGLVHDYAVAPTQQQGPGAVQFYPGGGVLQGKYAMWMGMLSERGGLSWGRQWPMRWGVVPLPRDQAATTLALVNGIFISATTEHPDECWKWVAFLSQQMPTGSMPTRKSLAESDAFSQNVNSEVAMAARDAINDVLLINPNLLGYEQALATLMEAFTQIRNGDLTPEVALEEAQKKADF